MLIVFISRNINYSSDAWRYDSHFILIRTLGFRDMIKVYTWNPNYFFWFLTWLIGKAGFSYHFFCVFINIFSLSFFAAGVYKLLRMYQFTSLYLLLIAFCSHDFFLYNSNALRQGVAMAFIPLFIYYLARGKYIRLLVISAVSFLSHTSGVVLFLLLPVALITKGRKKLIAFFFILCLFTGFYFKQIVHSLNIPVISDRLAIIAGNESEKNLMFKLLPILFGSAYLVWRYDRDRHVLFVVPIAIGGLCILSYNIAELSSRLMGFWYYSAAFAFMSVAENRKYLYHLCFSSLLFLYEAYVITHESVLKQFVKQAG
ncbi:MAG: EpsG family protein [Spirochaetales bacterium]|nr:EpsG family protein [Spirochaetales bacterium]